MIALTIGLGWLTGYFIYNLVVNLFKVGKFVGEDKTDPVAAKLGGCLMVLVISGGNLLAIATTIGALFAIHG